jgi:hypothetical protein
MVQPQREHLLKPGATLYARSAADYDCVFQVEIVSRTKSMAVARVRGRLKRLKIHTHNGTEGVYAHGRFSLAPFFSADQTMEPA